MGNEGGIELDIKFLSWALQSSAQTLILHKPSKTPQVNFFPLKAVNFKFYEGKN